MPKILTGQIVFACGLAILNSTYASQIAQMELPFANGEPGPAFFPMILCTLAYLCIAAIILSDLRDSPSESAPRGAGALLRVEVLGPILAITLTILYILAFVYTGYAVATLGYTFLIALFFNYESSRQWLGSALKALATALGITLSGWLFFVKLFDLYLPIWEL